MLLPKYLSVPFIVFALFSTTAFAYVAPAEKIFESWQETYENAPALQLQGQWLQGAMTVPFTVMVDDNQVKISEPSLAVTDVTSKLLWRLLLRPRQIIPTLIARGLDVSKTGLARHNGKIALTIGVEGEKETGTQIWLDRETKRPLRLILELDDSQAVVNFEGYDESPSALYPSSIRMTRDSAVRTYQVDKLSRKTSTSSK